MKARLRAVWLLLVGALIGFALGRYTGSKPPAMSKAASAASTTVKAVAVDCYDAKGNLVPDEFAQFGGVTISCAPGQTARVHQPPASPPAQDQKNAAPAK
jgi:hypothetical protein